MWNNWRGVPIVQQATPYRADLDRAVIAVVKVKDGQIRKLTEHKALEGYPVYSPDGRSIAYGYPRDGDFNNETELFVTDSSGGNGAVVTRQLDRNIVRAVWTPSGDSWIRFRAECYRDLQRVPHGRGPRELLDEIERMVAAAAVALGGRSRISRSRRPAAS